MDSERTTGLDIIQVGTMDVPVKDGGKRPIVLDNPVKELVTEGKDANDHEASSSQSHHFLPKWCPTGLTSTHRRKLQRLRFRERREQELEKQRDEFFNQNRPMIPQRKEWRPKEDAQPEISRAVRPATQAVQTAGSTEPTEQAIRPPVQSVRPAVTEELPEDVSSDLMACDDELPSVPSTEDEE